MIEKELCHCDVVSDDLEDDGSVGSRRLGDDDEEMMMRRRQIRRPSASLDQDVAEGFIVQEFTNLKEELDYTRTKCKEKDKLRLEAEAEAEEARLEADELRSEAEELRIEKEEWMRAYREKEWLLKEYMRKGMLLEDVVDQLWQLTEPNCNYYDLEEVVSYDLLQ